MKLKIADIVKITAGKDRGKTGKVQKVDPRLMRVLVEGVNKYKKHVKARGQGKPGGIVDRERALPMGNVALICPTCKQITRVGYKMETSGGKTRICRKCKANI
ncbi:MAG: 50S ribosomal protein L24 [Candidatus Chisholmbacteria bacterium RIFCSPHIGHO2_12_FULL_49_9]|uniref:Large ribosomal subunit protein uL24 n=1 Tax=Candidatus Chisholmbacteria bacterium RIFCSPHIGHO2_01_FULL_52_32 TaxID=1797591 RepID=A0A1G1VU04_9BACT|nr:MAG: 50S ribosomal protein L24 [Candidatus Chisholmbacteria bacterium RIFCSPHIGHO2_01_FULL_52_32]OGY19229.1 MAG: 50S ribosomal protein L24 [Candidatus Chisholmbacteria bacterium RIFCSPHIGHO2_12_FULL_49_9]OGY19789.1 MAG: 50S ribosomal protein L24 [Candidatus Chisholmbacteria bacterium RIFCSPLOWO2_01_FULL_50_28]